MKVLDPQSALLTTAELQDFLNNSQPRKADVKVGGYASVNVDNYNLVRKDLETYLKATTPHVFRQLSPEKWMHDLIHSLKKYELTKTEVFALINLGVGTNDPVPEETVEMEENGMHPSDEATQVKDAEEHAVLSSETTEDSGLDLMLFGLVVEESDERFAGAAGEQKISEILKILRETFSKGKTGRDADGGQHEGP